MKRFFAVICVTILLLLFVGCENNAIKPTESVTDSTNDVTVASTEPATKAENTGYTFTKITLDKNSKELSERFDEIGIVEAAVDCKESIKFIDGTEGIVYLIRDTGALDSGVFFKYFLAVETADKYIIEEYGPFCGTTIYVNDLDGDKADEITLCSNTGGTALTKIGRVYKVENDALCEIFRSSDTDNWDTGFEGVTKDNFMFEVTNKFTGYSTSFQLDTKRYIDTYYDEKGNVIEEGKLWLLSFKDFYTDDKDNDGVYEIYAEQHACLVGKNEGLGYTKCTYKFNNKTDNFEVVDAELISPYNMDDKYLVQQGEYYSAYKYDMSYFYKITAKDGTVRNVRSDLIKLPDFNMLSENLLEVTGQAGTGISTNWAFYYDADTDKLSQNYNYVYDCNTELVAYCQYDGNKHSIIVQDMFDRTKYYNKFNVFSSPINTTVTEPIRSVEFSDDGKSIKVVYLAGDEKVETEEIFELY